MAWVDPAAADSATVIAGGAGALAEYQRALDEWRVLTAAALVGLVEETMTIAAEFAKTRYTLGVPISTLQGISHPLANMAITVPADATLPAGRPGSSTTSPTSDPSWPHRRSCSWPRKRQGGHDGRAYPRWPWRFVGSGRHRLLVRARGWPLAAGDPGASAKQVAEIVAARESREERS